MDAIYASTRKSIVSKRYAGAMPNEQISAIESNSFPILDVCFRTRAARPSRASATVAVKININEIAGSIFAYRIAENPKIKFSKVSIFGTLINFSSDFRFNILHLPYFCYERLRSLQFFIFY